MIVWNILARAGQSLGWPSQQATGSRQAKKEAWAFLAFLFHSIRANCNMFVATRKLGLSKLRSKMYWDKSKSFYASELLWAELSSYQRSEKKIRDLRKEKAIFLEESLDKVAFITWKTQPELKLVDTELTLNNIAPASSRWWVVELAQRH